MAVRRGRRRFARAPLLHCRGPLRHPGLVRLTCDGGDLHRAGREIHQKEDDEWRRKPRRVSTSTAKKAEVLATHVPPTASMRQCSGIRSRLSLRAHPSSLHWQARLPRHVRWAASFKSDGAANSRVPRPYTTSCNGDRHGTQRCKRGRRKPQDSSAQAAGMGVALRANVPRLTALPQREPSFEPDRHKTDSRSRSAREPHRCGLVHSQRC